MEKFQIQSADLILFPPAQQCGDRQVGRLPQDVPERHVERRLDVGVPLQVVVHEPVVGSDLKHHLMVTKYGCVNSPLILKRYAT